MTVNISLIAPKNELEFCIICRQKSLLNGKEVVIYEGKEFPICESCIVRTTRTATKSIFSHMSSIARGAARGIVTGFCLTQAFVRFDYLSVNQAILVTSVITAAAIAVRVLED